MGSNAVCHGIRGTGVPHGERAVVRQLPCASGTYGTQEAGTRSPYYVQYGAPGAYVSAQSSRHSKVPKKRTRAKLPT